MATKATNQRNWTIMVYLAGDNNLDSAGLVDLKEMKTTGTTDKIAVLAQFDRAGAKRSTVRYCLKKGTTLAKDAVAKLGETNTGDPKVLEDFVTWGVTNYPADHYLLVLWNHGAGWDDANIYEGDVFSGTAPAGFPQEPTRCHPRRGLRRQVHPPRPGQGRNPEHPPRPLQHHGSRRHQAAGNRLR